VQTKYWSVFWICCVNTLYTDSDRTCVKVIKRRNSDRVTPYSVVHRGAYLHCVRSTSQFCFQDNSGEKIRADFNNFLITATYHEYATQAYYSNCLTLLLFQFATCFLSDKTSSLLETAVEHFFSQNDFLSNFSW